MARTARLVRGGRNRMERRSCAESPGGPPSRRPPAWRGAVTPRHAPCAPAESPCRPGRAVGDYGTSLLHGLGGLATLAIRSSVFGSPQLIAWMRSRCCPRCTPYSIPSDGKPDIGGEALLAGAVGYTRGGGTIYTAAVMLPAQAEFALTHPS